MPGQPESAPLGVNGVTAVEPRRSFVSRCWTCICLLLASFQTIIIGGLIVALVFLGLQVQFVTYELVDVQNQVKTLQDSLQNQTQGQIDELSKSVEQEHSLTLYQMAGTFSMLTCLLTMFHMSNHLRNYYEPLIQRKIVALLWMSPIYSLTSFLSLVFPAANSYLAIIREFYEAYAIFTFLSFLIAVLGRGDRQAAVDTLALDASHLQEPTKWLRAWYHPPPETSDMAKANAVITECTILCMQYVFVRPITAIISFVATTIVETQFESSSTHGATTSHSSNWQYFTSPSFYCDMIMNVSIIFAFNGLLKFHHAVDKQLAWCQPFQKFITVKAVVFLTFWQGLLINIVVQLQASDDMVDLDVEQQASQIQNFLICLEMLLFSIAHWCVFPVEEWEPDYRPKKYAKPGIGLKDFAKDVGYIMSSRSDARRYRKRADSYQSTCSDAPESIDLELADDDNYHVDDQQADYVEVTRPDTLSPSSRREIL
ncbi:hypothetical protein MPSEU_000527100 [Mayamaea pseudoterrestris]|nr:hypothetical protein MPSEU_000527100 [Mayamaea pseudoterrestris]